MNLDNELKTNPTPYERQIFVCTNDACGEKPSCGDQDGEAIFKELRRIAKERGLHPRIRVAQAKCLGKCTKGAHIMVYPDNVWHSEVTLDHIDALAAKYLPKS